MKKKELHQIIYLQKRIIELNKLEIQYRMQKRFKECLFVSLTALTLESRLIKIMGKYEKLT